MLSRTLTKEALSRREDRPRPVRRRRGAPRARPRRTASVGSRPGRLAISAVHRAQTGHRHREGLAADRLPRLDERTRRAATGSARQTRFALDDELDDGDQREPGRSRSSSARAAATRARTHSSATSSPASTQPASRSTHRSTTRAGTARSARTRSTRTRSALDRLIGSRRTMLWLAVGVVFLALWAALALLVRGASRILRRQNVKLRARTLRLAESNRLLEESALEAVESLNATVDAKDPYTAGHSQRVQRIAVALGRGARARAGAARRRSASPGSSTTSARSASPTRSSRSRTG